MRIKARARCETSAHRPILSITLRPAHRDPDQIELGADRRDYGRRAM